MVFIVYNGFEYKCLNTLELDNILSEIILKESVASFFSTLPKSFAKSNAITPFMDVGSNISIMQSQSGIFKESVV